jgi:protein disulfide-isomerase
MKKGYGLTLVVALMATTLCAVPAAKTIAPLKASGDKTEAAATKTKGWLEDFEKAQKEAAANKQPIFALFTGSDWCPWCMKLEKEKLDTKEFKAFAAANLILFKADFPQAKSQSKTVKKQNAALRDKYGVRGYPTVFLLDAEGKSLGQTGYQEGDGAKYAEHIKGLLEAKGIKTAEAAAEPAKALTPYEKAKAAGQKK